jgi:hypothetical protein
MSKVAPLGKLKKKKPIFYYTTFQNKKYNKIKLAFESLPWHYFKTNVLKLAFEQKKI